MTLSLFGATGRTGALLLDLGLARGHALHALVRTAGKLGARPGLQATVGDSRDSAAVGSVVHGSRAVLCCLGMHDIAVPATDFSDSVKTIVAAMQAEGVKRIVAIASAGVLDHPAGGYRHQHEAPEWLRHVSAEHQRNLETLRASGLDWTLMCPLMLVDDIPSGRSRRAFDALPGGSAETGYADLAQAMLELLDDPTSIGRRVGIVSDR